MGRAADEPLETHRGVGQASGPKALTMECTVPVEIHLVAEHTDIGPLERVVTAALSDVGRRLVAPSCKGP